MVLTILGLAYTTTDVSRHSRYLIHLTTLIFAYCICVFARLLLPTSSVNDPSAQPHHGQAHLLLVNKIVAWTDAIISLFAFLLVGRARRGPHLIFESSYDAKADSAPNPKESQSGNVAEIASCSVFDFLFFGWVAPIVSEGYKKEQMDQNDLPYLTAEYRSSNLFKAISSSVAEASKGQSGVMKAVGRAPKWINPLLWRVIVINKHGFGLQIMLALLNSVLYYAPAFFLRKIVFFLEHKESPDEQQSAAFGFAYCAGLLLSMVLEATVSGQLWYISNSVLCARIRVQLGTALYAKTLRRKDVTGLSTAAKAEIEEHKKKVINSVQTGATSLPAPGKNQASAFGDAETSGVPEDAPLLYTEEPEDESEINGHVKGKKKEKGEEAAEGKEKSKPKDEANLGTKTQVYVST